MDGMQMLIPMMAQLFGEEFIINELEKAIADYKQTKSDNSRHNVIVNATLLITLEHMKLTKQDPMQMAKNMADLKEKIKLAKTFEGIVPSEKESDNEK